MFFFSSLLCESCVFFLSFQFFSSTYFSPLTFFWINKKLNTHSHTRVEQMKIIREFSWNSICNRNRKSPTVKFWEPKNLLIVHPHNQIIPNNIIHALTTMNKKKLRSTQKKAYTNPKWTKRVAVSMNFQMNERKKNFTSILNKNLLCQRIYIFEIIFFSSSVNQHIASYRTLTHTHTITPVSHKKRAIVFQNEILVYYVIPKHRIKPGKLINVNGFFSVVSLSLSLPICSMLKNRLWFAHVLCLHIDQEYISYICIYIRMLSMSSSLLNARWMFGMNYFSFLKKHGEKHWRTYTHKNQAVKEDDDKIPRSKEDDGSFSWWKLVNGHNNNNKTKNELICSCR